MSGNEIAWRDSHAKTPAKQGPGAGAYVRPWATTTMMVPAGWAAHAMWGDAGLGTAAAVAGIAGAGAAVTALSYQLTRARTWYACMMATASTGASSLWLAVAAAAGTGRPVIDVLIIAGAGMSAVSNVHTWSKGQGAGNSETEGKRLPSWAEVTEHVKLYGTRMRITKTTENQVKGKIEVAPGKTLEEVQSRLKELASAYGVAPGAVRIAEDPTRADRGEITIIIKDVMGQLIPWPGLDPALAGASIADAPLELGLYEDGEPYRDELNNRHTLTCGMSGAGKSVHGKIKIVQVAQRRDTFVCAIDLSKGRQTLGPVAGAIGWPAFAKKDAKALLAGLKRAVKARADHLAERGLAGWTPDCGLTFLHALIEEAADLADFDELVELLRAARSVGIHIELSLQRATWGNLDTDARANLGDGVCFGVRDEADSRFVLPDYVTEAGGDPARWRKSKPGAAYAAVEYADVERHTVPVKMYGPPSADSNAENTVLTPAAESVGDQDAKLDPVTRAAFGAAYADYLAGRGATQTTAPAVATPEPIEEEDTEDDTVEPIVLTEPDDDPELTAGIDDPIEMDGEDFALPPRPRSRESAEQARAQLDAQLQLWTDQGIATFRAPELGRALRDGHGLERSRGWVIKELTRLAEQGRVIHHDGGEFEIVAESRQLAGV